VKEEKKEKKRTEKSNPRYVMLVKNDNVPTPGYQENEK